MWKVRLERWKALGVLRSCLYEEGSTSHVVALVAHLLPDASAAAAAEADERLWLHSIRDAAKKELPPHALPAHWMLTKELASLADGESKKLDRKKLPKPKIGGGSLQRSRLQPLEV